MFSCEPKTYSSNFDARIAFSYLIFKIEFYNTKLLESNLHDYKISRIKYV